MIVNKITLIFFLLVNLGYSKSITDSNSSYDSNNTKIIELVFNEENLIVSNNKYTLIKGLSFNIKNINDAKKEAEEMAFSILSLYLGFEIIYREDTISKYNESTLLDEFVSDDIDTDERKFFLDDKSITKVVKNNNKELLAIRTLNNYIKPLEIKIKIKHNYLLYQILFSNEEILKSQTRFNKRYLQKINIIKEN